MLFAAAPVLCYLLSLWVRPFFYAGLGIQTGYVLWRGFGLGRLPLVGPHDTLIFMSASVAAFSIPLILRLKESPRFNSAAALMSAIFTALALLAKQHNTPLPPVLKTIWFEMHVVLAFLSYALFAIGAILGGLYLKNRDARLEGSQYRIILTGYSLFSLSIVFGGVWAFLAWGTYWLWTPKELWTSILWLYYSFYLHARLMQGWRGKASALLGIVGLGVVLFTYLGVSLLMKSSHSF